MRLNVAERIVLAGLLPGQGNIVTARRVKSLHEKLIFTDDELQNWEIRNDPTTGRTSWNPSKVADVDFDITPFEQVLVADELTKLNEQKMLAEHHVTLWEKFCSESEDVPPCEKQAG